jgi:secreted Zn-dependent insulinase-like peptidase
VIGLLQVKDANLSKEASRNWNSIQNGLYDFESNVEKIALCGKLTVDSVTKTLKSVLFDISTRINVRISSKV